MTKHKKLTRESSVEELPLLSVRAWNALEERKSLVGWPAKEVTHPALRTIGDLLDLGRQGLLNRKGVGRETLHEILAALDAVGCPMGGKRYRLDQKVCPTCGQWLPEPKEKKRG